MILDVAIRSENLLQELFTQLAARRSPSQNPSAISPNTVISPSAVSNAHRGEGRSDHIANATLSPFHASTTESILSWPQFAEFGNLIKERGFSVFSLESLRTPLAHRQCMVQPYVTGQEVESTIRSFERGINFWYPTMARATTQELQAHIIAGTFEETTRSCLSLLIMALGYACQLVGRFAHRELSNASEADSQRQRRLMAELYFDSAFKKIYLAQAGFTADAVQCLFFTGLYFSFLQRPLQAWSFINAAATKCRLLLSYEVPEQTREELECLRRIFWSCYILESDFLAELAGLPQTGIAEIESSIPLPGDYCTQDSESDQEQSSLYFLACISMRRLLNRVHDLLYARDVGVGFDNHQFPSVVSELAYQLDEWKDLLPFSFQFSINLDPTRTEEGAFLRQRYLTCKSVIYRPYLTWALSNGDAVERCPPIVYEGSKLCLEACWMHAQNLRSLPHTIMVDTWICSLSMASVILITLAASRVRALRRLMSPSVLDIGPHLNDLLTQWTRIPGGGTSPSVMESIGLIANVSTLLKITWNEHGPSE
ncbi:C6 transcription factor [Penicillium brasilianum]|uniref:C6 transcription factor n=1 Tax=Penicillium brasilianum TaxID=104259 RepID=A0A1S9RHU0_PENBI|nr:C6 transcription factor [Penicillium brasilianum]